MRAAGIDVGMRFIDWWKDHPFEDDLKMLAWSDNEMGGRGFIDWYPFQHPQLGPVEVGGGGGGRSSSAAGTRSTCSATHPSTGSSPRWRLTATGLCTWRWCRRGWRCGRS